jgi:Rrf2 family protein
MKTAKRDVDVLITKEVDYALRILRALGAGGQRTANELADGEQIPQQFAYKILKKLKLGGLVDIRRGADGGCSLAADLRDFSLYDLMRIMEADGSVAQCLGGCRACPWRAAHGGIPCTANSHLAQIQRALDTELKSHSLYEILFEA